MGLAGRADLLFFFLVVGTVAADQIFTTSGEHTRAPPDLSGATESPLSRGVFLNPNLGFRRCIYGLRACDLLVWNMQMG
jgi:hypothetical protein